MLCCPCLCLSYGVVVVDRGCIRIFVCYDGSGYNLFVGVWRGGGGGSGCDTSGDRGISN